VTLLFVRCAAPGVFVRAATRTHQQNAASDAFVPSGRYRPGRAVGENVRCRPCGACALQLVSLRPEA